MKSVQVGYVILYSIILEEMSPVVKEAKNAFCLLTYLCSQGSPAYLLPAF